MDDAEIAAALDVLTPNKLSASFDVQRHLLFLIAHILLNIWRDHNRRENDEWQRRNG